MGHFLKLIGLGLLATLATLVVMTLLPSRDYIRWQAVKTEAYARLGWVYERVHDDATPIDVAFLGTSHTMNGIDAGAVAKGLGELGLRGANGACPTATNFAMPAYGRNLHYVVAREALANRKIDLLVVEILENETRKAHPLFVQVATVKDVVTAPALINVNYAMDVARLPYRQLMLSLKSAAPGAYGLKPKFDRADYDGSDVDNTRVVNVGGVELTSHRDITIPTDELEAKVKEYAAAKDLNMLPKQYEKFEYAVPNHYVGEILDLAKKKGVRVVFLYMPGYGKPEKPYATQLYDGRGDILYPVTDLIKDKSLWLDADHLNIEGASRLSSRLPAMLAPQLEAAGWTRGAPGPADICNNGIAPRTTLKPFRKVNHDG